MNPEIEFRTRLKPDYSGLTVEELSFCKMIDYSGQEKEYKLDFITAEGSDEKKRPCVFFIHGGGFQEPCDKRQAYICVFARCLAQAGYAVVSPDYPLFADEEQREAAGGVSAAYHKSGEAVHLAYEYMKENAESLGIDPDRIAIMGGSAGGSASFYAIAEHLDRYKAFINLWGTPETVPDLTGFPPTLSVHGTLDPLVPYAFEAPLQEKFEKLGIKHSLITLEGEGHTPLLRMDDFLPQIMEMLKEEL